MARPKKYHTEEERKEAARKAARAYRLKNIDKIKAQQKKWRDNHVWTEEELAARKAYYYENKEKMNAASRKWQLDNPEQYRKQQREWHRKNRARIKKAMKLMEIYEQQKT